MALQPNTLSFVEPQHFSHYWTSMKRKLAREENSSIIIQLKAYMRPSWLWSYGLSSACAISAYDH